MLLKFSQTLINLASALLETLCRVLPTSPFEKMQEFVINSDFLSFVNYFLPLREIVVTCELWLVAIITFYVWMILGRWIKVLD